jgi:hypothetical protein
MPNFNRQTGSADDCGAATIGSFRVPGDKNPVKRDVPCLTGFFYGQGAVQKLKRRFRCGCNFK